jgi:hypothetical protein
MELLGKVSSITWNFSLLQKRSRYPANSQSSLLSACVMGCLTMTPTTMNKTHKMTQGRSWWKRLSSLILWWKEPLSIWNLDRYYLEIITLTVSCESRLFLQILFPTLMNDFQRYTWNLNEATGSFFSIFLVEEMGDMFPAWNLHRCVSNKAQLDPMSPLFPFY